VARVQVDVLPPQPERFAWRSPHASPTDQRAELRSGRFRQQWQQPASTDSSEEDVAAATWTW